MKMRFGQVDENKDEDDSIEDMNKFKKQKLPYQNLFYSDTSSIHVENAGRRQLSWQAHREFQKLRR